MPTEDKVRALVLEVLQEVQSVSGREWTELCDDDKPIGSVDGFDSLSAVEASVMLEEKLGCKIEIESVFLSKDGRRALTLKEITVGVCSALSSKGSAT